MAYEVWCPHCKVTLPPEKRVCLHCGGRTVPERDQPMPRTVLSAAPIGGGEPVVLMEAPGPLEADDDYEQAGAPRSLFRVGFNVLVLVAMAAMALLRACADGR